MNTTKPLNPYFRKFRGRSTRKPLSASLNKSAQIEVTFNWVYILIAGAIILLFFVGLVVKQKAVSEERLAIDVVDIMDSIFTGASVSEKTKQPVDTSGLADYTLFFDCSERVSEFGIKGQTASEENAVQPLFAPHEIQTSRLLLWSLPYYLPYKVIDFLFVTSINTKYFIVGSDQEFISEFLNATEGFNIEYISAQDYLAIDPEGNYQVRIIDVSGTYNTQPLPPKLAALDDNKVTMVAFLSNSNPSAYSGLSPERYPVQINAPGGIFGAQPSSLSTTSPTNGRKVNYYQKENQAWQWLNLKEGPIQIISLGGEKDAAKYAAIFAADGEMYKCNMGKAFQRLQYLTEIYAGKDITRGLPGGKLKEMIDYYATRPEEEALGEPCLDYLQVFDPHLSNSLMLFQNQVIVCQSGYQQCTELVSTAEKIRQINQDLGRRGNCLTLY